MNDKRKRRYFIHPICTVCKIFSIKIDLKRLFCFNVEKITNKMAIIKCLADLVFCPNRLRLWFRESRVESSGFQDSKLLHRSMKRNFAEHFQFWNILEKRKRDLWFFKWSNRPPSLIWKLIMKTNNNCSTLNWAHDIEKRLFCPQNLPCLFYCSLIPDKTEEIRKSEGHSSDILKIFKTIYSHKREKKRNVWRPKKRWNVRMPEHENLFFVGRRIIISQRMQST